MTQSKNESNNYTITKEQTVFQGWGKVNNLEIKVGKNFDGSPGENITREVYQRGSGNVIGVLLYDPKSDNIILVEQLRAGVLSAVKGNLSNFYASEMNPCCKEIVLGMIESDELPEQAAIRESLEETGCEVLELSPIIKYFSSPGGITEYVHLYAGRVNTSVQNGEIHGNKEENEDIKVHVLPASEAIRLLYANQLNDGHTIIAIQWFATRRTDLRSKWLVKDVGTSII